MAIQEPNESEATNPVDSGQNTTTLFSPRFKSLAAMAGWDEESILTASLIVEDTPDRQFKHKKRSDLHFKTPPSNASRRKRRAQRKSPISISVPVISLDDEEEEEPKKQEDQKVKEENIRKEDELKKEINVGVYCSKSDLPCMDKLREELSCAICLEICYEPSTTSCGHSFCKKCLKCAADKCGKKCPKCRQLISNGRSCTVNTVLWNTIQLLFPQEVEARKAANEASSCSREAEGQHPPTRSRNEIRNQIVRPYLLAASSREVAARRRSVHSQNEDSGSAQRSQREDVSRLMSSYASGMRSISQDNGAELPRRNWWPSREAVAARRRRGTPSQDEDAALALRLQREEFMEAFSTSSGGGGGTNEQQQQSGSSALEARESARLKAERAFKTRMRYFSQRTHPKQPARPIID